MKHILVTTDLSESTESALEYGPTIADKKGI